MKKTFNQATGETTWHLQEWYQKTLYVVGIITAIYLGGAFMLGLFIGLMDI